MGAGGRRSLIRTCAALRADGGRCKGVAVAGSDHCVSHHPAYRERRRRAASKAARSKPSREIIGLKDQAATLYEEVHSGAVEAGVGAVLTQLLNCQVRILEAERKLRETSELEDRIAELEGRAWDA